MRRLQESQRCNYHEFHSLNGVATVECCLSKVVRTDSPHIRNYLQNTLRRHSVDRQGHCGQIKLATQKCFADLPNKILISASIFCNNCLVCERDAALFIRLNRPKIVHQLGGFEGSILENTVDYQSNTIIRHVIGKKSSVALGRCVVIKCARRRLIQKLVFSLLDDF